MNLSILSEFKRYLNVLIYLFLLAVPTNMVLAAASESKRELVILNWPEFIDPEIVEKFEQKYNVTIKDIFFESDDYRDNYMHEIQGKGVDLIMVNGLKVSAYIRQNWVAPLTIKEVPNLKHIETKWLNLYESTEGYVLPYFWGTSGIAYRKDLIKSKVTSWMDLFQPNEALRGKIVMIGSHRDLIGAALKAKGYSLNSTSYKELKEAKELLLNQKPYVAGYEYITLDENSPMAKGDVHVAFGYSGDILTLKKHAKNVEYVLPKEGGNLWVDYWMVANASHNKDMAYRFLNFINQPAYAAQLAEWAHYASPNKAAEKLLPAEFLSNKLIYPPKDTLNKSEVFKPLPPRVKRYTKEIFSHVTQ